MIYKINPKEFLKWHYEYIYIYISKIALNVNRLNASIKGHRQAERIQKHGIYVCCLQETHFRPKQSHRLKVRGQKKCIPANGKQKKVGVAILISGK